MPAALFFDTIVSTVKEKRQIVRPDALMQTMKAKFESRDYRCFHTFKLGIGASERVPLRSKDGGTDGQLTTVLLYGRCIIVCCDFARVV